jgi:hypothetical protein
MRPTVRAAYRLNRDGELYLCRHCTTVCEPPGRALPGGCDGEAEVRETVAAAGRACCCPARPLVVAVIPPAAGRPHPADQLCGHHHRACRNALQAAGAAALLAGSGTRHDRAMRFSLRGGLSY